MADLGMASVAGLEMIGFPRMVGSPRQHLIADPAGFFKWWLDTYGNVSPMFIAHNGFVPPAPGEKVDKSMFRFRTAFGDFDTGDGSGLTPAQVWEEVRRAAIWLVERRIEHAWKYSGSDCGFHLRVFFTQEDHHRTYLERWENAFWRGMKHALQLRSINIRCANPLCLERLPFTPYVHKKDPLSKEYKMESNYCVPVPVQWILDDRLDLIRHLSQWPRDVGPVRFYGAPVAPLETIVRQLGWDAFGHETNALHPLPTYTPGGSLYARNLGWIPHRKCLQILPFGSNPRHAVRLAWVHEILALGLSSGLPFGLDELIQITDALAEEAQWEDRGNIKTRHDQVTYAWKRPYAYNQDGTIRGYGFSCRWLRESGVCLGPSCTLFRTQFPEEWQDYLDHHPEVAIA